VRALAPSQIRNVVLVGHGGSGKTTLAEALLHAAGATNRLGRVEDGNTVMDHEAEERERRMSMALSLAQFEWAGHKVNLLDTPGFPDFIGEVASALRVADLAVFVVSAVDGVEVQTEVIWRMAAALGIPRAFFVNKLDRERASFDATLAQLRLVTGIVAGVVLVLAAAAAWAITRRGLGPLDRITTTADRIAAGDLAARTSLWPGDDEVGRLARAFDGMADRVDATFQAHRQFAADASHELRSPLTVLGGYVDVLARTDLDAESRARTLEAMRREIDRLTRLSSDLLLLTQLEAGGGRLAARRVDLGDLVEDIGAAARIMGPDRRIEVVRNGPVPVEADPDRLTQALMNLVDNAVRHTPPGGEVRLSVERRDSLAVAEVRNDGIAIAPEDLDHVFDRFYRVTDGVASQNGHHAGLGLAIVKAIAEASGGRAAASSDAAGTSFTILLPTAD